MTEPAQPLAHFGIPADERYLEDYVAGACYLFGTEIVDETELTAFARRYDPQNFHVDAARARETPFGGLIASGWHTAALMMRMLVDNFVPGRGALASPGVDAVRWLQPVRPGDTLRVRVTVLEARRSRTKPDRGIVRSAVEVLNQDDAVVMTLEALSMIRTRPDSAGPGAPR